jgi:hypothetical protein
MQESLRAMKIALRVLGTLMEKRSPEQSDVAVLRELAPSLADAAEDELARDVIRQAVRKLREQSHTAGAANSA